MGRKAPLSQGLQDFDERVVEREEGDAAASGPDRRRKLLLLRQSGKALMQQSLDLDGILHGSVRIEDLELGEKLRVTEIVPEGYQCESENPQEITIKAGTNTLNFSNKALTELEIIKASEDGNIEGITFTLEK